MCRTNRRNVVFKNATNCSEDISPDAILTVSLLAAPLLFLVGIGGFDYWFHWAIGGKTRPEDHSDHGARTSTLWPRDSSSERTSREIRSSIRATAGIALCG